VIAAAPTVAAFWRSAVAERCGDMVALEEFCCVLTWKGDDVIMLLGFV